jgi:methyltransferase-like protein
VDFRTQPLCLVNGKYHIEDIWSNKAKLLRVAFLDTAEPLKEILETFSEKTKHPMRENQLASAQIENE